MDVSAFPLIPAEAPYLGGGEEPPVTTEHTREPTRPDGRADWHFDDRGVFVLTVRPHAGDPGGAGAFLAGAGCDPTTIADAGLVAWFLRAGGAAAFPGTFAVARGEAAAAWAAVCTADAELRRRGADLFDPEPSADPWWAEGDTDA